MMTKPTSPEAVSRAIARFGVHSSVKIYAERSGEGYRWSLAHRGGPYPLLREVARFLDLPYTSVVLPCASVDGWTVVAPTGSFKYVPADWAIFEASADRDQIARSLGQISVKREDAPESPHLGMPLAALGVLVSLFWVVARVQVGAGAPVWILSIGLGLLVLGLSIFFVQWVGDSSRRAERRRISTERLEKEVQRAQKLRAVEEEVVAQMRPAGLAERVTEVLLRRGPCFGNCPIYEVGLRHDGTARWHGEESIHMIAVRDPQERVGDFTGHFPRDRFVLIADLLERSGFFGWEETYRSPVTDQATIEIEVTIGWLAKRVVSVYGQSGPTEFDVATSAIDALANQVEWRGVDLSRDTADVANTANIPLPGRGGS